MPDIEVLANEGRQVVEGLEDPSCLVGLSLSDAFRKFVLGHPEVVRLGKLIVEQEGKHADVFSNGQYPGMFVRFIWPLDITADDLAFEFVSSPIFIVPGPPLPTPSKAMQAVSSLMAEQLEMLRRALTTDQIGSSGTFAKTGNFGPIHRLQWGRDGMFIDVRSGDLLQAVGHNWVVQWSGVILDAPVRASPTLQQDAAGVNSEVFHVNSTTNDCVRSNTAPVDARSRAGRLTSPQRASIDAAVAAIWPDGIPAALALKTRDQKIIDWQKEKGFAVASSKTIARHLRTGSGK
jgi:hypothetical protein